MLFRSDERFFKSLNEIHQEFLIRVLDMIKDEDFQKFPDFMKLELLEIAKQVSSEIDKEKTKE